ncbi:zinc finger BED domain-containing protein RICESLEEPER 2-like [Oryza brachyantha]|uniref:zinc finger BED domain-containing protein RICESLEEPER 2-like n=1 Tax=Oryza brachyantha TaxID=4533 RepID=UPI001ADC32DA|nr:zinc finger BED domain-containing protein RICESLEEPER 2-like [Oryza brachyantha]XP_015696129.2 zinc finger BED domain-containing protein RICESLEEPER 2-like [Oryza brachyantha]XP_015696130.2 zinc finger BED domain-containing protein RICESLEEPER 2-like [Oryza brachyantha]
MAEPNISDNTMVQDSEMVDGNETVQGNEMVNGNDMVEGNAMVHGNDMIHGNDEMVQGGVMIHGNELVHVNEMVSGDEMIHGNELVNVEAITPTPSRRRRKKSLVWEHFTIEAMPGGSSRACCNLCKQTFAYSSGSKIAGTSHLKRHITLGSCPMLKSEDRKLALPSVPGTDNEGEGTAERPAKRRYRYTGYANATFDQDRSCSYLAKMIILHDYPLHIVQQPAFTAFIESLQPRFRVADVDAIEGEVYSVYQKEKENLLQAFSTMPGRISLTIGLWTTSQTLGYVSVAGQFIDTDWKVHRRMLNFMMVSSPHSENALSEAISSSLADWNMKDRLFTITLDNDCSSHDIYSANLRDYLSNKNTLMLKGQLFVVRCYAHILNAVAQDVIASIHGVIYNIRESIKFIKASPVREEKFAEIALQLEIPSTKTLCLDVTTQWNTTYLMLLAALDYRQAFTTLETCDDNYNEAPSAEDWKKVEAACNYLKLLYDSAHSIMAAANPTSNIFFHEAWKLQLELSNAIAHEDPVFSTIAKDMHERFDKYWKDCNLVLAIAVVMDPRFKMKLVEFSYSKIYGVEAARYVKVVDDAVHELYKEYVAQPLPLTPAFVEQGEANKTALAGENNAQVTQPSTGDGLLDFDMYLSEIAVSQPTKSELEQYLEEALTPRIQEFDILDWWKLNTLKFPTLSKMARDILAIPMSMVSSGSSIFSAAAIGSRILDDYRSSLRPETVEALFCTKDWLQYAPAIPEAPSTALVKAET